MEIIKLNGIYLSFKDGEQILNVLKGINLTFNKGEIIAIIGESGSGKTSLLNIIAGQIIPNHGDIFFKGKALKNFSKKELFTYRKKTISYIYQQFNLLNNLLVTDNLEIVNNDLNVVEKTLKKIKLEKTRYQRAITLSGGEQQRIALGRCKIKSGEIILADEPTGSLDSNNTKLVMEQLINSSAQLIIFVTHDISLANTYASRIISLKDGNIISDTKLKESNNTIISYPNESYPLKQCLKILWYEIRKKHNRIFISFLSTLLSALFLLFLFTAIFSANAFINNNYTKANDASLIDITSYRLENNKIYEQEIPYPIIANIREHYVVRENITPILNTIFQDRFFYNEFRLSSFYLKASPNQLNTLSLFKGRNNLKYNEIIVNESFCRQVLMKEPNAALNESLEVNFDYVVSNNIIFKIIETFKIVGISYDSFLIKNSYCFFNQIAILDFLEKQICQDIKLYDCFKHDTYQIEITNLKNIIQEISNIKKNPFFQDINKIKNSLNFSIADNEAYQDYLTYSSILKTSSILLYLFLGISLLITVLLNINTALSFIFEIKQEMKILNVLGVSNINILIMVALYMASSFIPGNIGATFSFWFLIPQLNKFIYQKINFLNILSIDIKTFIFFIIISLLIYCLSTLISAIIIYKQNQNKYA